MFIRILCILAASTGIGLVIATGPLMVRPLRMAVDQYGLALIAWGLLSLAYIWWEACYPKRLIWWR